MNPKRRKTSVSFQKAEIERLRGICRDVITYIQNGVRSSGCDECMTTEDEECEEGCATQLILRKLHSATSGKADRRSSK